MSEEEKKAIERLRSDENKIDGLCEDIIESRNIAIETVLNLINKLQKENEELRKGQNSLMQSRKKWKDRYYKLKAKSRKVIDLMAQNIELQQFANIDITNLDLICKKLQCNKKCRLVNKDCIKKYFKRINRR